MLKITDYLKTGFNTSDATATAEDIAQGKTAYGASGKLTGTMSSGGSFYKCASVNVSDKTWSGYKAVIGERYITFSSAVTSGLTYSGFSPHVGRVYTEDGLMEMDRYTDASVLSVADQLSNINAVCTTNTSQSIVYSDVAVLGYENDKIYAYDTYLATASLGSDGNIYPPQIINSVTTNLRYIDTTTDQVVYTNLDVYTLLGTSNAPNRLMSSVSYGNKIYFSRWSGSTSISNFDVYDIANGTYSSIMSSNLENAGARAHLGPDNKIYFFYASGNIYRVDPSTDTAQQLSSVSSNYCYPVNGADGYIYIFNKGNTSVDILRLDPATGIIETLSGTAFPGSYFPALYLDGKIYAARSNVLWRFNPAISAVASSTLTGANTSNSHRGMILAPDGYFYTVGYNVKQSGRVDPVNSTITYLSGSVNQACWCISPSGDMYAIASAADIANRKYTAPAGLTSFSSSTLMGPYIQH